MCHSKRIWRKGPAVLARLARPTGSATTDGRPARSVTETVTIDRPWPQVHRYLADARNWPQWSAVNALAATTGDPDWRHMTTPRNTGQLRRPRRRGPRTGRKRGHAQNQPFCADAAAAHTPPLPSGA
jgi:hypothetical protein